jgi:hypothetical protein
VREANCPGLFAQGTGFFVVFVHKAREANSEQNLVLQYAPGFQDEPGIRGPVMSPPPSVSWLTSDTLKISETGAIDVLVKKREHVDGINIEYAIDGHIQQTDTGATSS